MKRYLKKFGIMLVMTLILALGFCISAFADDGGVVGTANLNNTAENSATEGVQLTAPEKGWKRYDDKELKDISAELGENVLFNSNGDPTGKIGYYDNTYTYFGSQDIAGKGSYIRFNFKGSKIRIISGHNDERSNKVLIKIDGINYRYDTYSNNIINQVVSFEKIGLENKEHTVEISVDSESTTYTGSGKTFKASDIDAIDIDSDGQLSPYNESITLDKSTIDLAEGDSAELTATTTPAAVGVTWTVSDPTVATIEVDPTNGKITKITALKEGSCTITATTADGSNLSASCVINVTKKDTTDPNTPPDDTDNKSGATLIINLTDGETKVFDVSASEAAKFKEWYNTKTEYENQITYEFDKTVNSSISIEEDVVHDQVTSYEIRKY